jgi:hypothetical protein
MDGLTNYCTVSFVTGRTLTPSGIEYVFEYLCSALSSVASEARFRRLMFRRTLSASSRDSRQQKSMSATAHLIPSCRRANRVRQCRDLWNFEGLSIASALKSSKTNQPSRHISDNSVVLPHPGSPASRIISLTSALHKTHLATIALNFTPWKAGSGFFPEESIPYWEVFEVARAQAHAATTNF